MERMTGFVELIKGTLMRPMVRPDRLHQVYVGNVFGEIRQQLKGNSCQVYVALDVRLTTAGANRRSSLDNGDHQITTVVQPDICVICDRTKLDDRGCVGSPDWIVEILSPSNTARDTRIKFDLYEESGVLEYWIVFPGVKTVAVYVLEGEQYQLASEYYEPGPIPVRTLPGLELEWTEVFAEA